METGGGGRGEGVAETPTRARIGRRPNGVLRDAWRRDAERQGYQGHHRAPPRGALRPRRRGRRECRVVARVFSARMEQLAQFVSKSFDNAAGEHAACRTTTERPPSARITLSVAHLLGDPAENESSTFSYISFSREFFFSSPLFSRSSSLLLSSRLHVGLRR